MNPFSLLLNIIGFVCVAVGVGLQFGPAGLIGFGGGILIVDFIIDLLRPEKPQQLPLPSDPFRDKDG